MAGIVINTKFNPFTYQELLAPALQMTEEHRKVEEGLATLKAQASKWRRLANQEADPIAHAQYQRFANDLEVQAAALSNRGLTTSSRRDLYDMSARYQSEIVPIEEAHKRREEQIKAQLSASAQNPTLIFSRKAQTTSLDDYINDPALSYEQVSGQHITQQVYNQAKALADRINNSSIEDAGDFIRFSTSRGVTPKDVMKVIMGAQDADPELVKIVESTIDMTGTRGWDKEALDQVYAAARQGVWGAVGKEEVNYQQDWKAQMAMSQAFQREEGAKDRAHQTGLQKLGRQWKNEDRYIDTGYTTANKTIYYDTQNRQLVVKTNGAYQIPDLPTSSYTEIFDKIEKSYNIGIHAYGGPLSLNNSQLNVFQDGGYKTTSTIRQRLQNLSPEEKMALEEERKMLRKLGTDAYQKMHHGYTPLEWEIYLNNGLKKSNREITLSEMKKGRSEIKPFVMDAFLDSTSSGLDDEEDSGGMDAISAEDNSISLIYDGSQRGNELKDHSEIKLSDSFWENIDGALAEKKYSFFTAEGEYKEEELTRGDIRIYVDHDPASDNHFIIVPVENDIFQNDDDYKRRVKNKQDYEVANIINNQTTRDKTKKAGIKK